MDNVRGGLAKAPRSRAASLVALLAAVAPVAAVAAEYIWPGSAPCNGTLQACMNTVASGAIIDLAPAGPINESLSVTKSLTLRPLALALDAGGKPLPPPVFSAGHSIAVSANTGTSFYFELNGIVLQRGHVLMYNQNTAATEIHVRGVTIEAVDSGTFGGIQVVSFPSSAQLSVFIENNRVTMSSDPEISTTYAGIGLFAGVGNNLVASISWNHVDTVGWSPAGIGIIVDITGSSSVAITGNRVRGTLGGVYHGGINVQNSSPTLASGPVRITSNAVSGEDRYASAPALDLSSAGGAIPAQVINNTLVHSGYGFHADPSVTGVLANNIFSDDVNVVPNGMSNEYNLIWNTNFVGTPGPGTVNADPLLTDDLNLRLTAASPARDAGNNADLPFLSINDADQRARIRNGIVDLGAYETGDLSWQHVATNANIVGNWTGIDNAAINCCNDVPIFATASLTRETVEPLVDSGHLGVFYTGTNWAVFHQDELLAMTPGAAFDIFYPVLGDHVFTQTVSGANISGYCTILDNPATNNQPNALLEVTANYNPSGAPGMYDNHPLEIFYQTLSHRWWLCHDDGAAMQYGLAYNVYVTPPLATPNAFETQPIADIAALALDHPLLNNDPCVAIQISAASNYVGFVTKVAVQYFRHGDSGRWAIVPAPTESGSPTTLSRWVSYHVLVDGAQANACRDDLIFASGF